MTYEPEQNYRPVVLVVEDHDDTRFMLRTILELNGYAMLEAADGLEGIEVAIRQHPDLVLIDGNLPKIDGLSAARRMREQESLRAMPIIALSGYDGPEFQAAARAAGCDASITKPLDIAEFRSTLNRLLPSYSHAA